MLPCIDAKSDHFKMPLPPQDHEVIILLYGQHHFFLFFCELLRKQQADNEVIDLLMAQLQNLFPLIPLKMPDQGASSANQGTTQYTHYSNQTPTSMDR